MAHQERRNVEAIFLDDEGVLNDNSLRAPQWQRLISEFMVSRFGGDTEAWGEANLQFVIEEGKLMHDGKFSL